MSDVLVKPLKRSRLRSAAAALLVIALGLLTRPLKHINDAVGSALGDALYAVLLYLLFALFFPRLRPAWLFLLATLAAWLVEASQLVHAPWLDAFRHTTPGALMLGGTFSVGDLVCYLAGTTAIFCGESLLRRRADG